MTTEKRGFLNDNYRLFYLSDRSDNKFEFHSHNFHKLIVFIQGNVQYNVEGINYDLKPWDVLLISDTDIHRPVISPDETYERLILWIHQETLFQLSYGYDFLGHSFEHAKERMDHVVRFDAQALTELQKLTNLMKASVKSDAFGCKSLTHAYIIELLVLVNRSLLSGIETRGQSQHKGDQRILQVLDHINSHLSEDLSIDALAQQCFLSRYYLMHQFKVQTGFTLHHYIQKKRLDLSNQLIRQGKSYTEAAYGAGFKEYSSFLRAYKKHFKQSPRQYHFESQLLIEEVPFKQE